MAGATPKINAGPALTIPLAFARKGHQLLTQALAKYPVAEKISALGEHQIVKMLSEKKEICLAVLGFVLIFQGAQFKNLLLCTQVVIAFLFERVKSSIMGLWEDVAVAQEKLKADEPNDDPKDAGDEQSKHAKKREAKKQVDKTSSAEKNKEDAEVAKKVLKVLDSEKISAAAVEVLAALMACILVIHGGLAQKIAIAHALVSQLVDQVDAILEFSGYEDVQAWTRLLVRFALYAVAVPLSLLAAPVALAMNASACGAHLVLVHGLKFLEAKGKVPEHFGASAKGLMLLGGLAGFGTLWQLWSWLAGGGLAWYFQVLYLPAVIAEGLLGLL